MNDLEHPEIERVNRTGLTSWQQEKYYGNDVFGNEVMIGDEIYLLHGDYYLKDTLYDQTEEVLKLFGAKLTVAKNERR